MLLLLLSAISETKITHWKKKKVFFQKKKKMENVILLTLLQWDVYVLPYKSIRLQNQVEVCWSPEYHPYLSLWTENVFIMEFEVNQVLIYGFDLHFCGITTDHCKGAGESCQSSLKCLMYQQNHRQITIVFLMQLILFSPVIQFLLMFRWSIVQKT